jgi:hypothetical protein
LGRTTNVDYGIKVKENEGYNYNYTGRIGRMPMPIDL